MVFSRALGLTRTTMALERRFTLAVFSLSVLFMCTVSSVLGYGIRYLFSEFLPSASSFEKQVSLFLAVIVSYCLMYLLVSKLLPKFLPLFSGVISYAAFSCAVYGTLLVSAGKELDLLLSLVHGVGAGCGMVLASMLLLCGHRRLDLRDVPRAFKGMPIMLLYIGMLSLVLYGLVGHNLPT